MIGETYEKLVRVATIGRFLSFNEIEREFVSISAVIEEAEWRLEQLIRERD